MTDDVTAFWQWFDAQYKAVGFNSVRQVEMAAKLGNGTLGSRYTADLMPTADTCVLLARVLNVPTVEVLDRAGYHIVSAPPTQTDNPALVELWARVQKLDAQRLGFLLEAVRGLTANT